MAKASGKATKATVVEIPPLEIKMMLVNVVGTTSLITNQWSEKAKQQMLDKQTKKATKGREAKNPKACYEGSMYKMGPKKYGFPSIGFKAAAVRAAKTCGMAMTDARAAFHVTGELVEIKGKPNMRQDMVRNQTGVADIRFRAEFKTWKAAIPVRYNPRAISAEQLINLFNQAGFGTGIGEWRPEKNGQHGMFEVKLGR